MKREPQMPAEWRDQGEPWAFPTTVKPERPAPLDLTRAADVFVTDRSMSLHFCDHCHDGIHVGDQRVNRRAAATSHVTRYYHPECVVLP